MHAYPETIFEFQDRFGTEQACWEYMRDLRWPNGFVCPRCGTSDRNFLEPTRSYVCQNFHQISVTNDTVMHRTHLSLRHWFWAAWLMTTQTPGISSVVLANQLGIKQESAYMMLQRLRAGMVDPNRTKLSGVVEMDETFISAGRIRKVRRGRGSAKTLVVAAVEVDGRYAGRLRLRKIRSASQDNLVDFAADHVEEGSRIVTDGWAGYSNLESFGYEHHIVMGDTPKEVAENLPHIHSAFGNLKTWLAGTHHGVSNKHLQTYLNEFVFRYNRRNNPQAAFHAVLGISGAVDGPEYEQIYSVDEPGGFVYQNPQ